MGYSHGAEQLGADKVHQLAFTFGKTSEALFYKFSSGNDGVVVGYVLVGDHGLHQREEVVQPSKGGSFATRWSTQDAVSAISEVRYRLSVRG